MARLERLSPANADETLAFLARRPYDNVYVSWLVATRQIGPASDLLLWRDDDDAVAAACYIGLQIVPCGEDPRALEIFGDRARRAHGVRMVVGPRPAVEAVYAVARRSLSQPSAVRASQPVYALERGALAAPALPPGGDAGPAGLGELDEVVRNSAMMVAGELGGDPHAASPEFRARTARIIRAGWQWRYRVAGELAFLCNVGSESAHTAQLQGVWTPESMRGAGHATAGLAAICAALLREHPTLSLYVNDFNAAAIALYERVGFARVGEFSTIILR